MAGKLQRKKKNQKPNQKSKVFILQGAHGSWEELSFMRMQSGFTTSHSEFWGRAMAGPGRGISTAQ